MSSEIDMMTIECFCELAGIRHVQQNYGGYEALLLELELDGFRVDLGRFMIEVPGAWR